MMQPFFFDFFLYSSKYFNCLMLMAPLLLSRIYETESKAFIPSSINAIATKTGALLLK